MLYLLIFKTSAIDAWKIVWNIPYNKEQYECTQKPYYYILFKLHDWNK